MEIGHIQFVIYITITYLAGIGMGWFACKYVNRMNKQKENNV